MTHMAYLDELGHVGPYVSREGASEVPRQTDEACLVGATQPRPPGRAVARANRTKAVYRTNTGEDKPRPYDVMANATCP